MENSIIVTTPAQLQTIIDEAVNAILPKLADFRRKNEHVETDGMNVDDAARFITEQGIPTKRFAPEAVAALQERSWTGNIRELRNVVERLIILGGGEISRVDVEAYA